MTVVLVDVVFVSLPEIDQHVIDLGRVCFLFACDRLVFRKTISLKQTVFFNLF